MKNYTDLLQRVEDAKLNNDDLVNFKVLFTETTITVRGELFENGKSKGFYNADIVGYFYIPTDKGYLSAKWKNSELGNMKSIEVNEELFNSLIPFVQPTQPKHFIRKTEGWGVAGVIANHINSKVDYASNKMIQ
tara:strand:+ start:420 stop:821 length:402 start_codon:yes stop_codon:yes gene_type:complete